MFINYLKIALRTLIRYKIHGFINIMGLSISLTCLVIIFLWIKDELRYDTQLTNRNELYQLTITHPNNILDPNVPFILPILLADEFPEIKHYSRIVRISNIMNCTFKSSGPNGQRLFNEQKVCLVDTPFFKMFDYPFIYGDAEAVLKQANGLAISKQTAIKYFGYDNPVGQTLVFNNTTNLVVAGVFDQKGKSHLEFDFISLIPESFSNDWNWRDPTYIYLDRNISKADFRSKISGFFDKHQPYKFDEGFVLDILPITKSYLSFGRMKYIYIFSVIGFFILFIATINYINLSTAQFGRRSIEMGLRRATGAHRSQLIIQLISESLIVSYIALFVALILAEFILPFFNTWFNRDLHIGYLEHPTSLLNFILIATLLGILAGAYPAWLFTYRNPSTTIRSEKLLSTVRRITIVSQFTISMLFIACNIVVFKQLNYIHNLPLGLSTDYILKVPINSNLVRQFDSYRTELKANGNIVNVTAGQAVPFNEDFKTNAVDWSGKETDSAPLFRYSITLNEYIETFGINVIEGRSFSTDFSSDISNYVINEAAARYMNLENPVGDEITFWGQKGKIIGVVKDFHHVSLHKEILPQIIAINPKNYQALQYVFIKISDFQIPATIDFIKSTTERFSPDFPFEYSFIDESIDDLYISENRLVKAISMFSLIALCISAMGIFGMTAFSVEKRMKEITMRKICGASKIDILVLLNKEIIRWVLIALIVGGPISFIFSYIWLRDFAYKTNVPLWIFLSSGLFILGLSLIASAYESLKAAHRSPVESLNYE